MQHWSLIAAFALLTACGGDATPPATQEEAPAKVEAPPAEVAPATEVEAAPATEGEAAPATEGEAAPAAVTTTTTTTTPATTPPVAAPDPKVAPRPMGGTVSRDPKAPAPADGGGMHR